MAVKPKPNELHITRVYDAPVNLVWDAWTDPAQVVKWWGPRGFTHTTHSKDLRVGGTWRYTMHGPDGTDWPNITKYHEVEPYKKLVYDHGGTDDTPPLFRVTVTFEENAGKTTMEMTMAFESVEKAIEIGKFIRQAGGNATWDRLAEYLGHKIHGEECFFITRTFDAPIEVVFKTWTDPTDASAWLPPTGFTMTLDQADVRSGSICMVASGLPGAATWPTRMRVTAALTQEGPFKTRVSVRSAVHGDATADQLRTFVTGRTGMTQGWTESFDKLEAHLAMQGK